MTQRAYYSILNATNTVNFNRLSPSYEHRLVKYGNRGMAIRVPHLDRAGVKNDKFEEFYDQNEHKQKVDNRYRNLKQLKGIDILLYSEYRYQKHKRLLTIKVMDKLAKEYNDYSPIPYLIHSNKIQYTLIYLLISKDKYPQYAEKYLPLISTICNQGVDLNQQNLYINTYQSLYHFTEHDLKLHFRSITTSGNNSIGRVLNFKTSAIIRSSQISFISGGIDYFELLINIPEIIYNCLAIVRPWTFSANLKFKITNPGEQFTNTFHQLVLDNISVWYQGNFYNL